MKQNRHDFLATSAVAMTLTGSDRMCDRSPGALRARPRRVDGRAGRTATPQHRIDDDDALGRRAFHRRHHARPLEPGV